MLKTKKWVNILVLIFVAICIIGCLAASVFDAVTNATDLGKLNDATAAVALCFAGYYIAMGYSKSEARYFKIFAYLFALVELCTVIGSFGDGAIPPILSIVALIAALIIAFVKNLGKVRSLLLIGLNFVCQAFSLVFGIVKGNDTFGSLSLVNLFTIAVLSAMFLLMVYAKYADKAERHKNDAK